METADGERVLILAPDPYQHRAMIQDLKKAGLEPKLCSTLEELCAEMRRDGSAVLVAHEAFSADAGEQLAGALRDRRELLGGLRERGETVERLRTEVASKNHEIAELNRDLKRANLDCEQFAFSASHELREPLRNLAIYSQKVRRMAEFALDEETRQCLSILLSSAHRMEALFRDLLAFLQVTVSTAVPPAEVDSDAVLDNVLATLQGLIRTSGATIRAGTLPPLCITEPHLFQLLENLIENAIKYQVPGVKPEIHIFARETPGEAVICVRDNGVGIAPQHQQKVFGLFKRLHTCEEYEGTGVGLAVCHKIAEQYRGQIWVESELGQGAVFCFRLPRRSESRRVRSAISA